MKENTFGLIVGTRGFFNAQLALEGRRQVCKVLDRIGYRYVILPESSTPTGAIETVDDARKCAMLFEEHRREISGIIVVLPNFGDEIGVVSAIHFAKLNVPILVQASDDDLDKVDIDHRRDSFCGKLSVCNNLYQFGIPFTDTTYHTCAIDSGTFENDIQRFAAVCRVANGLRSARIGAIGARPGAFQTMRFSEKLAQRSGLTVITVDLSEILGNASKIDDSDAAVKKKIEEFNAYGTIPASIKKENITRQAKFTLAVEKWIAQNDIDAAGIQCWTSIQENYGCAACLTMSMLGDRFTPAACETDIGGVISMYALMLASGNASALLDWNNNYGDDRDMCVCTHCSNYPKSFFGNPIEISNLDILGKTLGAERCFGAVKGKVAAGPMTYFRISTDDAAGRIKAYVGNGEFTDDPCAMNGGIAVCRVPKLQNLMKYMCKQGYEHHVGMVRSHCADIITEAATTYLNWDVYNHI